MKFVDFDKTPEGLANLAAYVAGLEGNVRYKIEDGANIIRVVIVGSLL